MQALKVKTPRGKRFYLDGKRVSEMAYLDAIQRGIMSGRYSCALTKISRDRLTGGEVFRHYTSV